MNEPTTEQETQYDRMLAANADEDIAAYLTGIDECNCVLPEQSCRICRGAEKVANGLSLAELLSMPSKPIVTALGDMITVAIVPGGNAMAVDCYRGLQALVDSGRYNEWSCHIGGRTTPMHVAEPVTGKATGPTFTSMHPEPWKAVVREGKERNG